MRKIFAEGQVVEVQLSVGGPWTTTVYVRTPSPGHHTVVAPEWYINPMTGYETTYDDPQAYLSHWRVVPSRRVRKAS